MKAWPKLARFGVALAVALAGAVAFAPNAAHGTTYVIASLLDGVAVDGECRLREAIRAANSNTVVNDCPAGGPSDVIVLAAEGVYLFDQGEELFSDGESSLTIRGASSIEGAQTIDLAGQNRFVRILDSVFVQFENLTIANGFGQASGGAFEFLNGSGLVLRRVTVRSSRSEGYGGAAALLAGAQATADIVIDRCRFLDNAAEAPQALDSTFAGALYVALSSGSTLTIVDSEFSGNRASAFGKGSGATGGALFLTASGGSVARLDRLRFAANEVSAEQTGGAALFGSMFSGSALRLSDVELDGNLATGNVSVFDPNGRVLELSLSGAETQQLEIRRFFSRSSGAGSPAPEVRVTARGASTALLESGLVQGGPAMGMLVRAEDSAGVILGQLTVADQGGVGLRIENSSTSPVRLESSILYGNGLPGQTPTDLSASGLVDVDRVVNHNWIGDQGDPDPLFVDPPIGDYSLAAFSGAVDAGDLTFASVGPFDVRHAPRVVGAQIDLGAFERGGLFADDFEAGSNGAWSSSVP